MKICFVAQQIYPYLNRDASVETAGGAELQQKFIGEGLRDRGYDISYITLDHGQRDGKLIRGMKVYKTFKLDQGIFGIRFFYPRLYRIWKALKKADADLYYVRCATFLPGIVSIFAQRHNKKFVFAGAHDTNFTPGNLRLPSKRDEILYKYGLSNAHKIIVQSEKQSELLRDNFNKKSKVIRNFYPLKPKYMDENKRRCILWVSTIKSWKRPLKFIAIAERFPKEEFVMIGGRSGMGERDLYDNVQAAAKRLKNLNFLGFQPFDITEKYFDRCKLFVNTSLYEGFPNTFLQAWSRGVPILSYVDPDNVVRKYNLGYVVSSEREMEKALLSFLSMAGWNQDSILTYFNRNHSKSVLEKYDILFKGMFKRETIN